MLPECPEPPPSLCAIEEPLPEGDYDPAANYGPRKLPQKAAVVPPKPELPFWQQPAWIAPVAFLAGFVTAVFAVGVYAHFATAAGP